MTRKTILLIAIGVMSCSSVGVHAAAPAEPKPKLTKVIKPVDWTRAIRKGLYFVTSRFINRALWFAHPNDNPDIPPVLLVLVHGSFAKGSPEFGNDRDPTYQGLRRYATHIAQSTGTSVLMLSFEWSGGDEQIRRINAGQVLANLLNDERFSGEDKVSKIIVVAHSHGGNVAYTASQRIKRPIDIQVNIGTPRRNEEVYLPGKIKRIYNIYSPNDPIQVAGSYVKGRYIHSLRAGLEARRQAYHKGIRVVNLLLKLNGGSPGHVVMKDVVYGLHALINEVDASYKIHDDLVVDVEVQKKKKPRILTAINTFLTTEQLFERRDEVDLNNPDHIQQLYREVDYSSAQLKKFKVRYNRDMRSKASYAWRVLQTINDGYRLAWMYFNGLLAPSEEKELEARMRRVR